MENGGPARERVKITGEQCQVRITETGHEAYGAWREGAHDDLVFAVALAVWYGHHFGRPEVTRPIVFSG